MVLIKWSSNYSVKIDEMDRQHQKLINLINQLHEAMMAGSGDDAMYEVLSGLVAYTKEHFASEEKLMQQFHFPQLAGHRAEHQRLVEQVSALVKRADAGQPLSAYEVLQFLREWLINHIQNTDRRYGNFISGLAHKAGVGSATTA